MMLNIKVLQKVIGKSFMNTEFASWLHIKLNRNATLLETSVPNKQNNKSISKEICNSNTSYQCDF